MDGEHVCGFMPNNDQHIVCMIGIFAANSVYVGCFWTNPVRELKQCVEDGRAKVIFCCQQNEKVAREVAVLVDRVKVSSLNWINTFITLQIF